MPLPSGTRLGPYEIVAPLIAGGMGEVYRAKDPASAATSRSRCDRSMMTCHQSLPRDLA